MGRTFESFTVSVALSSHNSEQDWIDQKAYEDLRRDVQRLIDTTPQYLDINAMVN